MANIARALTTLVLSSMLFTAAPAHALSNDKAADSHDKGLETLNAEFRSVYQKAKERIIDETVPLLICYSDHMILLDKDSREEINFIPAKYTRLKTIDHIPLALFVLLDPIKGKLISLPVIDEMQKLKSMILEARSDISALGLDAETLSRQYRIIDRSIVFMDRAIATQSVSGAHLTAFCHESRADVMLNAAQAVGAQLAIMDDKMVEWKKKLGEERFKNLQIAIVSGHMPREEHSCFQYFARVYGVKREGLQIVYSEGLAEEKPTRELVATHILDASIGEAFFKEKLRMHRDLLADGAREYLDKHQPKARL